MDRLRVRIKDRRILALVKAFLKAGIMTPDGEEESHSGTPAGGILSPLLANIALSALDDHFAGQWQQLMKTSWQWQARRERGLGNWKMIRFADDFVVMVAGESQHAEALREEVSGVLATLGLRLAAEKTRVVHIDEGFDFLSITIRRMRKRGTSRHYVYTKPSKKAIQAVKDKVTAKTYRSTLYQEPAVLIQGISQTLRGWANYHRHGVSKAVFSAVDSHAWNRIMRWLRRKYQGRTGLGMPELRRRFCVPGTWKLAHNGVVSPARPPCRWSATAIAGRGYPAPTPNHRPDLPAEPAAKAHGAPGAVRIARRVRRGGRGDPPGAIPAGRLGPTQPVACSSRVGRGARDNAFRRVRLWRARPMLARVAVAACHVPVAARRGSVICPDNAAHW